MQRIVSTQCKHLDLRNINRGKAVNKAQRKAKGDMEETERILQF